MTESVSPASMRDRVHDLATSVGATFSASQFDGGVFYQVTMPGKGSVAISFEWGDDPDRVIEVLKGKMSAAGMLTVRRQYLLDFGGGKTATIWAADEQQAVRLVGQGEPESITDLATGDSHQWVAPE